ncbi:MAG: hypothetical protein NTY83_02605 [Candidatus Micrarchaeota archaeon]|nr:hypothetical protein [Candidatus Micrarchaeota archaeon]
MRCREGIANLAITLSREGRTEPLQQAEKEKLLRWCGKQSAHDMWVYARQECDSAKAAVMWREAGVKNALEGRTFEARQMLESALGMLDGAGELRARKSLHALFIKEARDGRQKSLGLAVDLVEIAAELIEPVDREEAFRLREEITQHRMLTNSFQEAVYHYMHMAHELEGEDPARAEGFARAAVEALRKDAERTASHGVDVDLEFELGKAVSLLARLLENSGSPDAANAYEEAGDHFLAGRESSLEIKSTTLTRARGNYAAAKGLGGDAAMLDVKISACEPEKMGCVVLTPEEGRAFMEHLARIEPFASTDDED